MGTPANRKTNPGGRGGDEEGLIWDRASAGLRRGPLGCAPRTWSRALIGSAPVECEGRSSCAGRRHRRPVDGPRAQSPAADGGGARGRYRPRGLRTRESSACLICPEPIQMIDCSRAACYTDTRGILLLPLSSSPRLPTRRRLADALGGRSTVDPDYPARR
jgi:hypothetical protein